MDENEGSEFTIREATVPQIQTAFKQNKLTSKSLVDFYFNEIQKLNTIYRAVIEVNPDALHEAEKADEERKANSPKSHFGLHGIPVLVKDNIATKDKLTLIDNLEVINFSDIMPMFRSEEIALNAEFKISLNAYLEELLDSPVRSLADVIAFNEKNSDLENLEEYPHDLFLEAENTNGIGELEEEALNNLKRASKLGFKKLMKENKLNALVTPFSYGSTVLAIGGYPGISVPAGYDDNGAPYGICFGGLKGSEPTLIEIAYGFEQATKFRKPPPIEDQL